MESWEKVGTIHTIRPMDNLKYCKYSNLSSAVLWIHYTL